MRECWCGGSAFIPEHTCADHRFGRELLAYLVWAAVLAVVPVLILVLA